MTRDECRLELQRLAEGFDVSLSSTRLDAYYTKLKHCELQDWHEAVTVLLCGSHFPRSLNIILDAVETASTNRRRVTVAKERDEAPGIVARALSGPEFLEVIQEHATKGSPVAQAWLARHDLLLTLDIPLAR